VLVNEIFLNPAGDEGTASFIELAGDPLEPLDGLELRFHRRQDDGRGQPDRRLSLAGQRIARDGYLVIANRGHIHGADVDMEPDPDRFNVNLVNIGGSLVLQGPRGPVDAVGWGQLPNGNVLGEGRPAPEPANGDGIARSNFVDSDDNARDFRLRRPVRPRGVSLEGCR
jgi:hypothetical protein